MKKKIVLLLLLTYSLVANSQHNIVISDKSGQDPDPSAVLHLISEDKGLLLPRMNSNNRNNINNPAESLLIFNTDNYCIEIYVQGNWLELWCYENDIPVNPCQGVEGGVEYNGHTYKVTGIGNQCWFAENLRTTKHTDGVDIPRGVTINEWMDADDQKTSLYAIYPYDELEGMDSDSEVVDAYGKLYNWHTVVDESGLCPEGWRVPTDEDWKVLEGEVDSEYDYPDEEWNNDGGRGYNAGKMLKSCRTKNHPQGSGAGDCNVSDEDHPRWDEDPTHYGTDDFEFGALPGGHKFLYAGYHPAGGFGAWWTTDEDSEMFAWRRATYYNSDIIDRSVRLKGRGYSVRCLKE